MFSMGVGSFLSRTAHKRLITTFIWVEISLGVVGGLSVSLLYVSYAYTNIYQLIMVLLIFIIGVLAGMEIPLVLRLLRSYESLRVTVSNVLSLDYIGALLASLLFPFILLPHIGLIRTSVLVGLLNMGIAWILYPYFKEYFRKSLSVFAITGTGLLLVLIFAVNPLAQVWESSLYENRIIYSKQTSYQKIVMTRWKDDVRLFLNGALQFSSLDEYRYHESLVHPVVSLSPSQSKEVLILGGGDGLAVRELLKYPDIDNITVVDLDPGMTRLANTHPVLLELNKGALSDEKVEVINQDAYRFAEQDSSFYNIIICDLPDPSSQSLSKLYTREFYRLLGHRLAFDGIIVTQATSPFFTPHAFWSIVETLESTCMEVYPYHTYIPTFGDWGFIMASRIKLSTAEMSVQVNTHFLTDKIAAGLFEFPGDLQRPDVEVNTINTHKLMSYYRDDWKNW